MDVFEDENSTSPSNPDDYHDLVREALGAIETVARDNPEAARYLIVRLLQALYSNSEPSLN